MTVEGINEKIALNYKSLNDQNFNKRINSFRIAVAMIIFFINV